MQKDAPQTLDELHEEPEYKNLPNPSDYISVPIKIATAGEITVRIESSETYTGEREVICLPSQLKLIKKANDHG